MQPWAQELDLAARRRRRMGFGPEDAYRLVDGDGGVFIDLWAGRWLVQTLVTALPAGLEEALQALGVPWWWKRLDRDEKDSPVPMGGTAGDDPFLITEQELRFEISFRSGYSQGLFLDQRDNRRRVRERSSAGQRILNLFAYTGGFSVAAAAAGATTTTVDLSGSYLEWAKRNFTHNGFDPAQHYFAKGDALDWLAVFARKQRVFDGIILDPPTFSRVKGRGVWRAEKDYHELVAAAVRVLAPGGWMLCSSNCRTLERSRFEEQLRDGFATAKRKCQLEAPPMPPDFSGDPYLLNAWCQ